MYRTALAFLSSAFTAYILAAAFYTHQILAKQAAIGAIYTAAQQAETYWSNAVGLWAYGIVIAVALGIGFLTAAAVKRVLRPLAPLAYPLAGATAILTALVLIESQLGGGAGIMGGALSAFGMALQAVAGLIGGVVFHIVKDEKA